MKKLKNIAIAVAAVVIFSDISHAQSLEAGHAAKYEQPLGVKYLGTDGEYLSFEVNIQPDGGDRLLFAIADENEGELYSSRFLPAKKVQTFKIEKRNGQKLDFKLEVGRKTFSKSFSVNTNAVEKTTVSESDLTVL
jgi:hypothetical protein